MIFEKFNAVSVTLVVVGGSAGVIALAIIGKFLKWLAEATWRETLVIIEQISALLISATAQLGSGVKSLIETVLSLVWNAILTVLLFLTLPIKSSTVNAKDSLCEYCKLRQLYWKYGHHDFKNFRAFRRHILGEEEPQKKPEPEPERKQTMLQEAQAIMGFSGTEPNTHAELKARHRQLMSVLHPDKGFLNTVFAQQVNEAVATIMTVRKWK